MANLLPYEEQIYLLYYYLRSNFIDISKAVKNQDSSALRGAIERNLKSEYGISDENVVNEIFELFNS